MGEVSEIWGCGGCIHTLYGIEGRKQFALVKFLKVKDIKSLVSRMQETWYMNYHVYANVAYDMNITGNKRNTTGDEKENKVNSKIPENPNNLRRQGIQNNGVSVIHEV